jgi:hypothetical protein
MANLMDPLYGEEPKINEKELAELERKFTTGDDINRRDILDDSDLRNIICDLLCEIRVLRARKDVRDDPLKIN